MTYLQLVNTILRRLREDEVGTVSENHYSKLVGAFVNDAKTTVEDAWQWLSIKETVTITTQDGTSSYDLEDYITDSFSNTVGNRARPWLDLDTSLPLLVCTTDGKEKELALVEATNGVVLRAQQDNDAETGEPTEFFFSNNATSSEDKSFLRLNLYPTPDAAYTYKLYIVNPQPELTADNTDVKVPAHPIIQLAYLYCLYERGEEVGEMLNLTSSKAEQALGDAIQHDLLVQGTNVTFTNY